MTATLLDHLFVHSAGLLVAGLLVLLAERLWRKDPVLSYRIMVAALITALLLPVAQLLVEGRAPGTLRPLPLLSQVTDAPATWTAPATLPDAGDTPPPIRESRAPAPIIAQLAPAFSAPRIPLLAPDAAPLPAPVLKPEARLSSWLPLGLFSLYFMGLLFFGIRQVRSLRATRRFLGGLEPVTSREHLAIWVRISGTSRLARRTRLVQCEGVSAPACWGVFRPVIVLPAHDLEQRPRAAFQWALLHELTHLERRDPLVSVLQCVMRTAFWFHPVAWWLSFQLNRLRELSCDLLVVRRTGRRRSYALALLDYAASADSNSHPSALLLRRAGAAFIRPALLHWSHSPSNLRRRIEMLRSSKQRVSRGRRMIYVFGAGLALSAVWAGQMAIAASFGEREDERLVALCDPKQKQKRGDRWQKPPRPQPGSDSDRQAPDIAKARRSGSLPGGVLPIHSTQLASQTAGSSWASSAEPLDGEIRQALVHTLLHDDTDSVRMAAARALAPHISDESVKRAFLKALKNACNDICRLTILDALLQHEAIDTDVRDLLVRAITEADGSRSIPRLSDHLATGEQARQMLISALADDRNDVVQLSATAALAQQVSDPAVQSAMIKALRNSNNEVARMAMIESLTPFVTTNTEVQQMFLRILQHDDNDVAKMAVAGALTARVDDPSIRQLMLKPLCGERDDVIKMAFAQALSPYAYEPAVKRTFVELIPKLGSEVIRMQIVEALARVITPGGTQMLPAGRSDHSLRSLPEPSGDAPPSETDRIPDLKRKRS